MSVNFKRAEIVASEADIIVRSAMYLIPEPNNKFRIVVVDDAGNKRYLSGSGLDGKSAYEVAVQNGYIGTVTEWLNSLEGQPGPAGASAYQVAVNNGFTGTESQWLQFLEGNTGPKGDTGDAATIQIGTVTSLSPNQQPTVSNTGTVNSAIFNFGIPKGETGTQGPAGPQGLQGVKGDTGYKTIDGVIVNPDDPTPTVVQFYKPSVSNDTGLPYPNLTPAVDENGNSTTLTAKRGFDTLFFFDGTKWQKTEVAMPEAQNKIDTWIAGNYSSGKQVINPDDQSIYEANSSTTAADVPGVSFKWTKKVGSSSFKDIAVDSETIGGDLTYVNEGFTIYKAFGNFIFTKDAGVIKKLSFISLDKRDIKLIVVSREENNKLKIVSAYTIYKDYIKNGLNEINLNLEIPANCTLAMLVLEDKYGYTDGGSSQYFVMEPIGTDYQIGQDFSYSLYPGHMAFSYDVEYVKNQENVLISSLKNYPAESKPSRIFNVMDFGAKGDGVTDDGPAIQNAMRYVVKKGGGVLFFPFPKVKYLVTSIGADRIQLKVPAGTFGEKVIYLELRGEVRPNFAEEGIASQPVSQNGCIIESSLVGLVGDVLLGSENGNSPIFGGKNYIHFHLENLIFRTCTMTNGSHVAGVMNAIDMNLVTQFTHNNIKVDTSSPLFDSVKPNQSRGIIYPMVNNKVEIGGGDIYIKGYDTALNITEHFSANRVVLLGNYVGLRDQDAYHSASIQHLNIESCAINIQKDSNLRLNIFAYDTEHYHDNKWYKHIADIKGLNPDPAQNGIVNIFNSTVVVSNVGNSNEWIVQNANYKTFTGVGAN